MKVKVELVYDGDTENKPLEVEVKDGLKGARLMNAIDKAVEKAAKDDKDWKRWNLVGL
jgi:hypothetical protein